MRLLLILVMAPLVALPALAQSADVLFRRGESQRASGHYPEASKSFRAALAADPSQLRHHLALGETLAWARQFREAEVVYRNALKRFPQSSDLRLALGQIVSWQGRYAEATEIYRDAAGNHRRRGG